MIRLRRTRANKSTVGDGMVKAFSALVLHSVGEALYDIDI